MKEPQGFPFGNWLSYLTPHLMSIQSMGFFVWDATSWLQAPCVVYLLSPNVGCAAGNENCSAGTKTKRNTSYLAKEDRSCHPVLHLHVSIMHLSHRSTIQCFDCYRREAAVGEEDRTLAYTWTGQKIQGKNTGAGQEKCMTFKRNSKGWGFTSSSWTIHQITKQSDHLYTCTKKQ